MKKIILLWAVFFQVSAMAHPLFMCSRYFGRSSQERLPLYQVEDHSYGSCDYEDIDLNSCEQNTLVRNRVKNILVASAVSGALGCYYFAFHDAEMNILGISALGVSAVASLGAAYMHSCASPSNNDEPDVVAL